MMIEWTEVVGDVTGRGETVEFEIGRQFDRHRSDLSSNVNRIVSNINENHRKLN